MLSKCLFSLCVILMLCNCAPSRVVEPLPQGKTQASIAIGGPLFDYNGDTIPMPLSSLTIAHGLRNNLTGYASLHTTSAIYGVVQTELGVSRALYTSDKIHLGISVSPALHLMFDKWQKHFKYYPAVDLNFYSKAFGPETLIYAGTSHWFELADHRAHGESQPTQWIPGLHVGVSYQPRSISYTLEMKYLAPFNSSENIVVDYVSPWNHGAIGLYGSIGWTFR